MTLTFSFVINNYLQRQNKETTTAVHFLELLHANFPRATRA